MSEIGSAQAGLPVGQNLSRMSNDPESLISHLATLCNDAPNSLYNQFTGRLISDPVQNPVFKGESDKSLSTQQFRQIFEALGKPEVCGAITQEGGWFFSQNEKGEGMKFRKVQEFAAARSTRSRRADELGNK